MRSRFLKYASALIWMALFCIGSAPVYAAEMGDYCVTPPFVTISAKPNLLLMLDNSASQYDLAYIAGSTGTTSSTYDCGSTIGTVEQSFCFDDTYTDSFSYYGYFDTTKNYQYHTPANNSTPGADDYFTVYENSVPTSGCDVGTGAQGYYCIQSDGVNVTSFIAKGNFLNWLATSKFDVQKKALTGGKYSSGISTGALLGETRGCNGRRFIKMVQQPGSTVDNPLYWTVTFAVRGPNAGELDYVNPVTQGGAARIEIYLSAMTPQQIKDCQCAIAAWTSGNFGQAKTLTESCLGIGHGADVRIAAFNQIMVDCWQLKSNVAGCAPGYDPACIFQGINVNSDKVQCSAVYDNIYSVLGSYSTCGSYLAPSGDSGAGWQCTSCAEHLTPAGGYASLGTDTVGFLGLCAIMPGDSRCSYPISGCSIDSDCPYFAQGQRCVSGQCIEACTRDNQCRDVNCNVDADCPGAVCLPSKKCSYSCVGGSSSVTWPADDTCVKKEILHYCFGNQVAEVIDPSSGAADTSATGNIPSILMDSTISQFPPSAGTLFGRPVVSAAPIGLLAEFSPLINFGAMAFNQDGSGSECGVSGTNISCTKVCSGNAAQQCLLDADCTRTGAGTCLASTKTDGAKIISYINYDSSGSPCTNCTVGDHTTSGTLIKTIDDLQAATWTPFAEAFYSAIGYFARQDSAGTGDNYALNGDGTPNMTIGYSRSDMKLNPSLSTSYSYDHSKNPSQYICQANDALIITDGMSTADVTAVQPDALTYPDKVAQTYAANYGNVYGYDSANSCPKFAGSRSLMGLSWLAKNRNIKTFSLSSASTTAPLAASQYINTFVVYTGPSSSNYPGYCNPYSLMEATALNGGTTMIHGDLSRLEEYIRQALQQVAKRASSGTAASVLASGEGSGAVLVQALFYPKSPTITGGSIFDKEIYWIGKLQNLWYYIDPFFGTSSMREDTVRDYELNIANDQDNIVRTYFNNSTSTTMASLWHSNLTSAGADVPFEKIKSLWDGGTWLWHFPASGRNIYTTTNGSSLLSGGFTTANAATLRPYLGSASDSAASQLISYIMGYDKFCSADITKQCDTQACSGADGTCVQTLRNRTVAVDLDGGGTVSGSSTFQSIAVDEAAKVWKLGDILNSTPRIASKEPLNSYKKIYDDDTYEAFTSSGRYTSRGTVFAGANDGMLHAFDLGLLTTVNDNTTVKGRLTNNGSTMGKEMWAFIPKHALPYLQYISSPSYCHVYTVDLSPYIFDASIGGTADVDKLPDGSTWRTIVIGGMRTGGACRKSGVACNAGFCSVTTSTACTSDSACPASESCVKHCVNTPALDPDPEHSDQGLGYSSYFALDVTDYLEHPSDPATYPPELMWEFSHADLGFSTTGPVIVRTGGRDTNGNWYVVFGSGPTGPIDTATQFRGFSDQNLKIFVLDLRTGDLVSPFNPYDTNIPYAFASSMTNSSHDSDLNYQDDVVYIGYTKAEDSTPSSTTQWNQGGIGRILTGESTPSNWSWSEVIDGIGPITTSISRLQSNRYDTLWLYFGTGRYFFKTLGTVDDQDTGRQIFGVKDPCFISSTSGFMATCPDALSAPSFLSTGWTDVTSDPGKTPTDIGTKGWYISLEAAGEYPYYEIGTTDPVTRQYGAERVITDTLASSSGLVYFTTFKPYKRDLCALGGKSFVWAVKYNTGGAGGALLKGTALLQVSTGSIEQVKLSDAFKQGGTNINSVGDRRSAAMEGVPPTGQGLSLMSSPPPVKRVLHLKER